MKRYRWDERDIGKLTLEKACYNLKEHINRYPAGSTIRISAELVLEAARTGPLNWRRHQCVQESHSPHLRSYRQSVSPPRPPKPRKKQPSKRSSTAPSIEG